MVKAVDEIVGMHISVPQDSLFQREGMKIFVLVPDTGDCALCNLQIYDWYVYKLDIDKRNIKCDILYILNKSIDLNTDVLSMLEQYHLNACSSYEEFIRLNPLLANKEFDVYLVSPNNEILLVGNPVDNHKLWDLYKKRFYITGKE